MAPSRLKRADVTQRHIQMSESVRVGRGNVKDLLKQTDSTAVIGVYITTGDDIIT